MTAPNTPTCNEFSFMSPVNSSLKNQFNEGIEDLKSPFKIPTDIKPIEERSERWLEKKIIIATAAKKINVPVIEKSKRIEKPEKVSSKRKLAIK